MHHYIWVYWDQLDANCLVETRHGVERVNSHVHLPVSGCMCIIWRSWGWMCITSETCRVKKCNKITLNNFHQAGPIKPIELSVFTIVPRYLNEITCSNCSSPVSMYVGWVVFLVQCRYYLHQTVPLIVSVGLAVQMLLKYWYIDAAFVIAVTLDPAYWSSQPSVHVDVITERVTLGPTSLWLPTKICDTFTKALW